MDLVASAGFPECSPSHLEAYARARACELDLNIPQAYLAAVLENLSALQAHSSILAARLEASAPQMAGTPAS